MNDNLEKFPDVDNLKNNIEEAVKLLSIVKRKACLTLLCALTEGKWTVTELAQKTKLTQPTASQCLHKMLDLQLLSVEKVTTTNYYSISSPLILQFLAQLNDLFRFNRPEQSDSAAAKAKSLALKNNAERDKLSL